MYLDGYSAGFIVIVVFVMMIHGSIAVSCSDDSIEMIRLKGEYLKVFEQYFRAEPDEDKPTMRSFGPNSAPSREPIQWAMRLHANVVMAMMRLGIHIG